MNTNGTEFNQERGQAAELKDTSRGQDSLTAGKCMMGNRNEFYYKDPVEQLSLETLDSDERKGSGVYNLQQGYTGHSMQWGVGGLGWGCPSRMQESHAEASVTEGPNLGGP